MRLEQYQYWGTEPTPPAWFKNLQKAWKSNKKNQASNTAIPTYLEWCVAHDIEPEKQKVGRPKTQTSSKPKRSEQMKQLLEENSIEVGSDMKIIHYPQYTFMPNGRLRDNTGSSISVYRFLQDVQKKK